MRRSRSLAIWDNSGEHQQEHIASRPHGVDGATRPGVRRGRRKQLDRQRRAVSR
jgi:hypothetical protein